MLSSCGTPGSRDEREDGTTSQDHARHALQSIRASWYQWEQGLGAPTCAWRFFFNDLSCSVRAACSSHVCRTLITKALLPRTHGSKQASKRAGTCGKSNANKQGREPHKTRKMVWSGQAHGLTTLAADLRGETLDPAKILHGPRLKRADAGLGASKTQKAP